jgi:hypothetical protein
MEGRRGIIREIKGRGGIEEGMRGGDKEKGRKEERQRR